MCMEGVDNGEGLYNVKLKKTAPKVETDPALGLPVLLFDAVREEMEGLYAEETTETPFTAKLIPYFAFANRGESDMRVWIEMV